MDSNAAFDELTDRELWRQTLAGERNAFGALFARHANAVNVYCFRRVASWSAAEDLVSVVFLEAWRSRDRLTVEGESALPLLYGIALRVTAKHHRSLIRYRAALHRLPESLHEPDPADDIAARIDDERRMRAVRELLSVLPRWERDVVELCVFAELDYAAAAVALGVPIGTVRSRLSRARARLSALSPATLTLPVTTRLPETEA